MGSDRFSLRWNNYQTHLVTAFESLLEKNEFVDVTLGCDGRKLSAHRMLLSACSPYFRNLLQDNHCQHPIILLRDITYNDMSSLLQFMYNGEVNVEQAHLSSFLKTAECLKIRGLTDNDADTDERNGKLTNESPNHRNEEKSADQQVRTESSIPTETPRMSLNKPLKQPEPRHHSIDHGIVQKIADIKSEVIDVAEDVENKGASSYPDEMNNMPIAMEGEEDDFGEHDLYESGLHESMINDGGMMNGHLMAGNQVNNESHASIDGYNEESGLYECRMCEKKFTHWNSARHHRVVHQGKTTCKLCNKVFSRMFELRKHMRRIHNEGAEIAGGGGNNEMIRTASSTPQPPMPSLYHSVLFNN